MQATATASPTLDELRGYLPSSTASGRAHLVAAGWPRFLLWTAYPSLLLLDAGLTPDPWQARTLQSQAMRTLLLCSRQAGKSLTAAALALREAILHEPALVLLLSPSERQSGELAQTVFRLYDALPDAPRARKRTELQLHLQNGSRIVALPENERTIRGYSGAALLVIDEAARVADALYYAVRPMLAVSGGKLVALSTPFGKRGWFYEEWETGQGWECVRVTAQQCPRISPQFLAEEEASLGPRWFSQEYECDFSDAVGAVFSAEAIGAAMSGSLPPLFGGS
jgi:hypothetical protein